MANLTSLIALAINCLWLYPFAQGSFSATYTAADIPTSSNAFSLTCNGSNNQLQVPLPAGESYPVTGINIAYSMTALGVGQMAHQGSQVKCVKYRPYRNPRVRRRGGIHRYLPLYKAGD